MASPLEPQNPEPPPEPSGIASPTAATFTIRYHRARLLAVAVGCFLLWCALTFAVKALPFHWANLLTMFSAVFLLFSMLCAFAPYQQPYLTFDSTRLALRGPGGWWWARSYPRLGHSDVTFSMRDGRIHANADGRSPRLPFPSWWAHPGDWAELAGLFADGEHLASPDWIRMSSTGHTSLRVAPAAIRIGFKRKPFFGMFLAGLALYLAECAGVALLPVVREHSSMLTLLPTMLIVGGGLPLLFNPVTVYYPQTATVIATSRMSRGRMYPRRGYDHLEYSVRLDAIHEVRPDGKRRLVAAAWHRDRKSWKLLTDLLQESRL
ncbi:hypothetical protein O1R50_13270 [Glycomyces luteolus]|uniref:Uncharacterized protein n=1 Tax=Glycomyces luteolus TaxID=2670330 RepID=A0A9X3PAQ7_9ACTN|nr:hypothetical protein [Glycomyces luteolus]MDA1360601.1 hypothetical protein [Glycomyces luteolus]